MHMWVCILANFLSIFTRIVEKKMYRQEDPYEGMDDL